MSTVLGTNLPKESLLEAIKEGYIVAFATMRGTSITTFPYDPQKLLSKLRLFNMDSITLTEDTILGYNIIIPGKNKTLLLKSL